MTDVVDRAKAALADCERVLGAEDGRISLQSGGCIAYLMRDLLPELVAEVERLREVESILFEQREHARGEQP